MTASRTQLPPSERIIRRIAPVFILSLGLVVLLAVANVVLSNVTRVEEMHRNTLDRANFALSALMERYFQALQSIANDARLNTFARDNADPRAATQRARDVIAGDPNTYQAVRYISSSGRVALEVRNVRGFPQISIGATVGLQAMNFRNDLAYLSALSGSSARIFIGRFNLRTSEDDQPLLVPRVYFPLYAPIFVDDKVSGVVQVEINAADLLNIINNADATFMDELPERHLSLMIRPDTYIADSGSSSLAYLNSIEAINGNISNDHENAHWRQLYRRPDLMTAYEGGLILSTLGLNFGGAEPTQWRLILQDNLFVAYSGTTGVAALMVAFAGAAALAAAVITRRAIVPLVMPMEEADKMALALAQDDIDALEKSAALASTTPSGESMIETIRSLAKRIEALNESLSQQINRRNRDLQVAGRIGRETAVLDDLDVLLRRAINLICNELGFYHAQVFLLDDVGRVARLAYSRGDAGQQMLARGHQIEVGTKTVIGTATAQRRPVIINDTLAQQGEVPFGFNPLLPETRAEMGLPLMIGDQVIGALDIQSKTPNVFLQEELPTFQLLADQLAIAIYNARLKAQAERRYQQINRLNRQLTRQAWDVARREAQLKPRYGAETLGEEVSTAPITIRGEVIGSLTAAIPAAELGEGERMILNAVAERVALAIENARLFQETQSALAETSTLYQLSRTLNEATSLDDVLQAIVSLIAPDASSGQVWLFDDYPPGSDPEWARLSLDLPLQPRRTDLMREDPLLRLDNYPLLQAMRPDDVLAIERLEDVEQDARLQMFLEGVEAESAVFVPLNMRGIWRGYIVLLFGQPRTFSERERRIYSTLIAQAGAAIDNRLLLRQTEEALSRNEKLYAASRIINTALNPSDLVYAAVATTNDPSMSFWLALLEHIEGSDDPWDVNVRLIARSVQGAVEEADEVLNLRIDPNSAVRRREPEIVVEPNAAITDVPPLVEWMRQQGQRFMAIFPLFSENQPIALFFLTSVLNYELSSEDYDVYKALTGQMSTQIQNYRLLARTEQALNETRRLYVASRAVSSAQDMLGIYEAMVGHLTTPFLRGVAEGTAIMLSLWFARPSSRRDAPNLELVYQYVSDDRRPSMRVGEVIAHQDAPFSALLEESDDNFLLYKDLSAVPGSLVLRTVLGQARMKAAAIAELSTRTRWFGVLICHTNRPDLLDESYVRFMRAIADQVSVALENQTLLREAEFERENLNQILSTLPAGVMVLDPDTYQPIQNNQRAEELLGRSIDQEQPFAAKAYRLFRSSSQSFYPDDQLPVYRANRTNQAAFGDDIAVIREDGTQVDLLINAAPIYDANGRKMAIVTALQDISNLRSLENTLQENLRETVALYETQRALSEANTLEEVLDRLIEQLSTQQVSDAYILLAPETSEDAPILARYLFRPLDDTEALSPLLSESPIIIDDAEAEGLVPPWTRQALENLHIRSVLVAPLRPKTRSRAIGWIMLTSDAPHHFNPEQERVLGTISDMASTALDNTFLIASTQAALQETAALYSATATISRARNLEELRSAMQNAIEALHADYYGTFLLTERGISVLFSFGTERLSEQDHHRLALAELGEDGQVYISDLRRATSGEFEREVLKIGDVQAVAAVNLRAKDLRGGRLFVGYRQVYRFQEGDIRYLNTIADSASVVLDNITLLEQIQSTLQETSILYQASRALTEANSPADIVDVIVNYLIEPHIDQVFIALLNRPTWDSPSAHVEVAASWHSEDEINLQGIILTAEQFPAWKYLASESVVVIEDVEDPNLPLSDIERISIRSLDTRSVVIAPLRVVNRAIGAIWLGSRQAHDYTDRDVRIFQAFAEQTSLSMEATRLLEQTERRAAQLETTAQISERVGSILDLDVLLPQVVELIRERFGYDHVQVFMMDDNNEWALLRASTGRIGQELLAIGHKLKRGSESVIGQVTARGELTVALDTADANVVHKPNPYLPLTRSELALPLKIKGEVVGALDVQSNQPNAFSEEDIQALTTLAAQISVAIDNARLYEEAFARAQDMSFLFDITNAAATAETLDKALREITQRAMIALNAINAVIYLPQTYRDYKDNTLVMLKPMALAGQGQPLSELAEVALNDSENLVAIAAIGLQPTNVRNVEKEVRYQPIASNARSAILIPVASANELVAMLLLESAQLNAFSHDDLTLLLTLAGSVSAIIQNGLLVEQLQATNERLREVDRLKSQFLANMSHELRTPLNSIIGFSRVMLKGIDGPLTEMQEQDLTTIYNSGNHLLNLINDILDQAKIEANEMTLKFAYFDIKAVIEGVRSIAIGLIKDKPLELFVEIAPNLPQAYGDDFRTRQVLLNLVSNAIKFTPEGSVTVRTYLTEDRQGRPRLRIDVIDTGIGIAEKDLPILFEAFRQVDSSLTRTVGGTGLGLPISKSLVELQGGELLVSSTVGVGSTFSITIPTEPGAEEILARRRAQSQSLRSDGHSTDTALVPRPGDPRETQSAPRVVPPMPIMPAKRDVLLIEDNKDMVDQFRRVLQRQGFEVQTADHPAYAEAMVGQLRPTVVVMDVNFADGRGWEILKNLKKRDDSFDIPIIVNSLSTESERAYQLGAYHFIQRPFTPDKLVEVVLQAEEENNVARIVVIDDRPEDARLIEQLLSERGTYRVFAANNGKDGISMVARRRPSLVILDLRMPEMDGFAVLNELRSNPETAKIPVLVVTGDLNLSQAEQDALANVRVVPKAEISQQEYERFLDDVRKHLNGN
ncbi:MAG: GAF domain-containing protein [Anaerolineae bacterium]|nr:GAF domain-containing protein [Anaerolineae bacterium]MDW8173676.1 GAF domain-containing protein [Anaerolineae bacterium]